MVTKRKKEKIELEKILFFVIIIILILFFLLTNLSKKIEILYFRNDNCGLIDDTDNIMEDVEELFGSYIYLNTLNSKLIETDPEDSEEIGNLREKYDVIGLPDIVINGKKMKISFTRQNIFNEICNNFIIKPGECL